MGSQRVGHCWATFTLFHFFAGSEENICLDPRAASLQGCQRFWQKGWAWLKLMGVFAGWEGRGGWKVPQPGGPRGQFTNKEMQNSSSRSLIKSLRALWNPQERRSPEQTHLRLPSRSLSFNFCKLDLNRTSRRGQAPPWDLDTVQWS